MTETPQDAHDRAPEPALFTPTFTPPTFPEPAPFDADSYADGRGPANGPNPPAYDPECRVPVRVTPRQAAQPPQSAPQDTAPPIPPAQAPAAPQGPSPVLAGTFALFVTPDNAIVLAYRPEGATADKQLLVPSFLVQMAARQTGHTPEDILRAIGESL